MDGEEKDDKEHHDPWKDKKIIYAQWTWHASLQGPMMVVVHARILIYKKFRLVHLDDF
jgi:hypothetical protein